MNPTRIPFVAWASAHQSSPGKVSPLLDARPFGSGATIGAIAGDGSGTNLRGISVTVTVTETRPGGKREGQLMPNKNGNSGDDAPLQGNGGHKEELRRPKANVPPELLTFFTHGLATADAEAQLEHDKWKSKKPLDDVIGKGTDKWIKRFCVAEVVAYHDSVKFAEGKPNADALKELARRTALSGLSRLVPDVAREKLAELLNYKQAELEDP